MFEKFQAKKYDFPIFICMTVVRVFSGLKLNLRGKTQNFSRHSPPPQKKPRLNSTYPLVYIVHVLLLTYLFWLS